MEMRVHTWAEDSLVNLCATCNVEGVYLLLVRVRLVNACRGTVTIRYAVFNHCSSLERSALHWSFGRSPCHCAMRNQCPYSSIRCDVCASLLCASDLWVSCCLFGRFGLSTRSSRYNNVVRKVCARTLVVVDRSCNSVFSCLLAVLL
jgi:hypothetical protein